MTSPADFADLFAECRTLKDSNEAYRRGIDVLREAHRLSMVKIVESRDRGEPGAVKHRVPQNESEGPLAVVQRSKDAAIRRWAQGQGIVFQRVNKNLRQQYEDAHKNG